MARLTAGLGPKKYDDDVLSDIRNYCAWECEVRSRPLIVEVPSVRDGIHLLHWLIPLGSAYAFRWVNVGPI